MAGGAQWDLQTDDDEVVHSVRFGTSEGGWGAEHTQTLANLKNWVTATNAFAGDRIGSVSGLTQ